MGQAVGTEVGTDVPEVRGQIGVVAASAGALREVVCLLARQGVAAARTIGPGREPGGQTAAAFLDGLRVLQDDPAIEVILAVAEAGDVDAGGVLDQVGASDRPTVLCLLGGDASLAWQAGAIPAHRLDEAAQRAGAWVRGWDQALASSLLEEQDEELEALAAGLRRLLGQGPRGVVGLFASQTLCHEAWLMLGDVAGEDMYLDCVEMSGQRMADALDDPGAGVIVLNLAPEEGAPEALADEVALVLERLQGPSPLIVAHVCGTDLAAVERAEARLAQAGVTIVGSNAAAARLAGLIVSR